MLLMCVLQSISSWRAAPSVWLGSCDLGHGPVGWEVWAGGGRQRLLWLGLGSPAMLTLHGHMGHQMTRQRVTFEGDTLCMGTQGMH